jgi:hypothetical protein
MGAKVYSVPGRKWLASNFGALPSSNLCLKAHYASLARHQFTTDLPAQEH